MAEIVASAVVGVLIEKLISGALINFARSQGLDSQLKIWKKNLPMIQAVLADAGQKQIKQKAVELWLIELQDLAYDIDDVLDDIATEVIKRKFEESQASTHSSSKLTMIFPSCCSNFNPHNMMYGRKMSSKLDEITIRLHDIVEQKNNLGLDVNVNLKVERSNNIDVRSQQTSTVNESKVLGREKDKEALILKLQGNEEASNNQNVISVVSIVGMGGLGKTTLAQILYNHPKVKEHFKLRAWVCVSDEFDVFNISKALYQAVGGEDRQFATLDLLHVALKEKISKKRFLFVLDDVWNEDHRKWDLLRSAFDVGAYGSKVLVTTRKKKVALVMDCFQPYELEILSDEIALSLFAQSALDEQNFDKHPSLKSIAQGIIKKCKGLPLALITLGKVLKTKENDDEWEELLNSEIWNLEDESGILPALKLSYYDLPSHLKQLFAYCSLFPKDYEFEKNKLILLWMAEGFLSQTKGNKPMEILGRKYFEELVSRSFFQPSANDESRYTMHDIMNDLAISVAGVFFFMLDDKMDLQGRNEAFEKLRHFSFMVHFSFTHQKREEENRNVKEFHKARNLRTFLPMVTSWMKFIQLDNVHVKLLPRLHLLRVLSLANSTITEVPQCVGNLKHLRYLNFSRTNIKQIPEQVSELYNLQTLLVCDCDELSSMPDSFVKLVNLRHIDMTKTPLLKKLPLGIGGLTSLQTLSKVIIEEDNKFKISELKGLTDLQGQLSIEGLDNVVDPKQAMDAELHQKNGLVDLELKWCDVLNDTRNPTTEYKVLEALRAPHSKLKTLKITGYGGTKLPSWVGDPSFDHLTELVLSRCSNCTELPSFAHLTSLMRLDIEFCDKLVSIGEREFNRSLKEVAVNCCASLESYCCTKSVERLEIENCHSMSSLTFLLPSSSLHFLSIYNCMNIKSISQEHLQCLTSLEEMCILGCPEMEDSFPSCGLVWPPNLNILRIGMLNKPMSEWGLQNYPSSLVDLHLYGYNSGVVSFGMQHDHVTSNTTSACFLLPPSLTNLYIENFMEVESVSEVLQHLPRLQKLTLEKCPKLKDVPKTTSTLTVLYLSR